MVKQSTAFFILLLAGCANIDYQVGDISAAYCGATTDEFRAQLKAELNEQGLSVGVDYCSVHGLIDAVVN
ncbi:hypothetical protein [Shewanella sediminis]|uniref:hypothetical protein n=1 Tax=Shewanella sediminis TaxID=271097 RepID=UPI0002F84B41|nr:hypothetical protein [Shewanella sediminis]